MCVRLRELTGRSKWCPISYLSAPGVYLPGYIIICWPSHMIWEREVQNPRHPREPSQDVMRDTGLWPNTLCEPHIWAQALAQYDLLSLSLSLSLSLKPLFFSLPSKISLIPFPLTLVTLCCPFFNPLSISSSQILLVNNEIDALSANSNKW